MLPEARKTKLSKYLSYVLRHHPETIGLIVDKNGWADVSELIKSSALINQYFSEDDLIDIVESDEKKRFSFDEQGLKIRANQGHSMKVDLELSPQVPPDILYHGTVEKFIVKIRTEGLQKIKRHHVHLTAEIESARIVARRRGDPIVLEILSIQMLQDGFHFYQAANGVWLTDHVPIKYIQFPE